MVPFIYCLSARLSTAGYIIQRDRNSDSQAQAWLDQNDQNYRNVKACHFSMARPDYDETFL